MPPTRLAPRTAVVVLRTPPDFLVEMRPLVPGLRPLFAFFGAGIYRTSIVSLRGAIARIVVCINDVGSIGHRAKGLDALFSRAAGATAVDASIVSTLLAIRTESRLEVDVCFRPMSVLRFRFTEVRFWIDSDA
jgi:hypothetical protein